MENTSFLRRIDTVEKRMSDRGIDCFLVFPSSTIKYLSGYSGKADERLLCLALFPNGDSFIIANKLYEPQVKDIPVKELILWNDGENAMELLFNALRKRGIEKSVIATDKSVPGMFLIPLYNAFPEADIRLGDSLVDDLRVYKDEDEMELMMTACRKAAEALKATIEKGRYWIGKTEAEFMGQLSLEMTNRGLTLPNMIVAVGANAAAPHHITGQTVIEEGKCLLVDFGGKFKNYSTDMTRTFHFGEPCDEFKKVYEIVLEANRLGKEAAREGNLLQDVDRAARGYITKMGYGEYFTHRTGHGIGIDGHEGPSAQEGELTPIKEGMAFSVEPGIYLPGKFGVRIEDQVLMTKTGARILHDFTRELIIIK